MPADRYSLAHHHDWMVPAPAGKAAVQVIWKTEDGITDCWGTTVPTDATAGYCEGCIFLKTDAATGLIARYVNVGTALSCDFNLSVTVVAQAAVADSAVQVLTGSDTVDITKVTADILSVSTAVNAVIARLETAGILATS